jgi:predicted DNA-binding transcriptional regulator AlpA
MPSIVPDLLDRQRLVSRDEARRAPFVLVSFAGLAAFGIGYTRTHTRRLVKAGRFPQPVRPSEGRIAWRSVDIHEWLANLPTGHIDRSKPLRKSSHRAARHAT